jgi:Fe-S-cluster containining protein
VAGRASEEDARGHSALDASDLPECVDCGVCCFSFLPEYIRVFGVDLARMDERAEAFVEFRGNRCFMRMDGGRCTALRVDVERQQYLCSIYAMRPDVCRSLERGSGHCRAERHEKSDRARDALVTLRTKSPG